MAPQDGIKATPKPQQRTVLKTKSKASPIASIKKTMATRKRVDTTQMKVNMSTVRTRASMAPPCTLKPEETKPACTSKPKETKPAAAPGSVTKSAKKVRKPKAAHSGVPVPMKMMKLMKQQAVARVL